MGCLTQNHCNTLANVTEGNCKIQMAKNRRVFWTGVHLILKIFLLNLSICLCWAALNQAWQPSTACRKTHRRIRQRCRQTSATCSPGSNRPVSMNHSGVIKLLFLCRIRQSWHPRNDLIQLHLPDRYLDDFKQSMKRYRIPRMSGKSWWRGATGRSGRDEQIFLS